MPPTRPKLRETLFFVWATLSEHKWVTFGERRGKPAARRCDLCAPGHVHIPPAIAIVLLTAAAITVLLLLARYVGGKGYIGER